MPQGPPQAKGLRSAYGHGAPQSACEGLGGPWTSWLISAAIAYKQQDWRGERGAPGTWALQKMEADSQYHALNISCWAQARVDQERGANSANPRTTPNKSKRRITFPKFTAQVAHSRLRSKRRMWRSRFPWKPGPDTRLSFEGRISWVSFAWKFHMENPLHSWHCPATSGIGLGVFSERIRERLAW